jgi:hypothetical protein
MERSADIKVVSHVSDIELAVRNPNFAQSNSRKREKRVQRGKSPSPIAVGEGSG